MKNLWQVFVTSLNGGAESTVSSRRLITMTFLFMSVITNIATIILAFIIAMRPPNESVSPIQALDRMIEVLIIVSVMVLLLVGIITWQNVNDTVALVRGGGVNNIVKAADNIQDQAQAIKSAVDPNANKPIQGAP